MTTDALAVEHLVVAIDRIVPSLTNPRKTFDKAALEELTASVRTHGILQPVLVRPWPASRKRPKEFDRFADGVFELVAGERRFRAATAAGLSDVPAVVHRWSDAEALEKQIVENLQRVDLHPLEEAKGFRQLQSSSKLDVAQIAERTGRSIKYVYDRMKLVELTKEAQKAFAEGRFAAGHAIILARLKPEDQKRAMQHGALYQSQRLLWDPTDDGGQAEEEFKAVSVRELQAWVDKHVRFETEAVDQMVFPETHQALSQAQETKAKVVSITHEHQVHPEARGEGRIYSCQSWKRADGQQGSKACPRSVTGVLVAGPGRGQAFDVCTAKEHCDVHWGQERRAKAKAKKKRATSGAGAVSGGQSEVERRREERAREEGLAARWKKATPRILEAVAERVKKAPARSAGLLGQILIGAVSRYGGDLKISKLVPRGASAEDLVRHAVFIELVNEARDWDGRRTFPKRAKEFGVDVKKILDEVAPKEKPAPKGGKKGRVKAKASSKKATK